MACGFGWMVSGLVLASFAVSAAHARDWQPVAGSGWVFDAAEIKTELKDDIVNTENKVVVPLRPEEAGGKKTPITAEPTALLYISCETRVYRLWDIATSTEQGPLPTHMFDVAQGLENYCSRIGKLPEERRKGPGQR